MVEYNRISQFIKLIAWACILLIAISINISWERSVEIVSSVCFFGLFGSAALFFTDLDRQKQNMLPMILLIIVSLVASVVGLFVWHSEGRWALAVLGIVALLLLLACTTFLGPDFMRELRRRFHTK